MDNIFTVKAGVTAFFAALTAFFGWLGWLVVLFIGCMVGDYISGTAAALKNHEWASATARVGLWHKVGEITAVTVAGLSDLVISLVIDHMQVIKLPFDYTALFFPIALVWYILTELGSIMENAGKLGAPIPPFLCRLIKALHDATDATGEKLTLTNKNNGRGQ